MRYDFLVHTYETERLKILSVWSMFEDGDLGFRPKADDRRGRSVHEQMVHQCVSEDLWFRNILGIPADATPLPEEENRLGFIRRYGQASAERLAALRATSESWWEQSVKFFETDRSPAWVMVRRVSHSSHHRGQQMAMLRMLGRDIHSNYGPTADTGGLMANKAPVVYAYAGVDALIEGEVAGGRKAGLPGPGKNAPTERPPG